MSVLVPLTADRVALAFTRHTTIHASAGSPVDIIHGTGPELRTVCGSDVHPYVVGVLGHPGKRMMMPWPPPPGRRCEDCCRLLGGTPRKPHGGWGAWDELTDTVPATAHRAVRTTT